MPISPGYKKMKNYLKESGKFKLISRWTNANTVECDDGKTVQSKIGGIDGISSSLGVNDSTQAASTKLTYQLSQNINSINSNINQLNSETNKLNKRCQRFANYSGSPLTTAIDLVFDAITSEINEGFFSWLVYTNQGYFALYGYLSVNMTGIATKIGDAEAYTFYKSSGGADAVLKKLGSDVVDLGISTSFDVKTYYADYKQLTTNDFVIEPEALSDRVLGTKGTHTVNSSTVYAWMRFTKTKEYNAETGILTAYVTPSGGYGSSTAGVGDTASDNRPVHAYLIKS